MKTAQNIRRLAFFCFVLVFLFNRRAAAFNCTCTASISGTSCLGDLVVADGVKHTLSFSFCMAVSVTSRLLLRLFLVSDKIYLLSPAVPEQLYWPHYCGRTLHYPGKCLLGQLPRPSTVSVIFYHLACSGWSLCPQKVYNGAMEDMSGFNSITTIQGTLSIQVCLFVF